MPRPNVAPGAVQSTSVDLDRTSGLISLGTHTFKILSATEAPGGSGYPYWRFTLECTDQGEDRKKQLLHMVSLSPQARWKLNEFLDAVNAPKKGKATANQFVGKYVKGSVIHDSYEGRDNSKLDTILPVTASMAAQISMQLEAQKGSPAEESEEGAVPSEEEIAALEEAMNKDDEPELAETGEESSDVDISGIGSAGLPEDVKSKIPVKPPF
jgi:hypothetical protein